MESSVNLRRSFSFALVAAFLSAACVSTAHATPAYSSIVVFGDSLSDNGNLYKAIGYPPAPYYQGRFSNGPVAVEQLASALGLPLLDFAVGGATTGIGNYVDNGTQTSTGLLGLPGMRGELAGSKPYLSPGVLSTGLFIVWGGANDFFTAGSPDLAASNIVSIVDKLEGEGAQHIIVPGVPDLGLTPEFSSMGTADAIGYSQEFNLKLQSDLQGNPATYVDTYNLLQNVYNNPGNYGLQDVKDPCFNSVAQTVCANPSQYLFWDGVHPTTTADAILEQQFGNAAGVTPEPESLVLLGTGVSWLAFAVRSRRSKVQA